MNMPLADIIDRWSIALLKKHAGGLNVDAEINQLSEASNSYAVDEATKQAWLAKLILFNSLIWSLESDIRLGREGRLGFEEVGRRAIAIRDHNKNRVAVKQEIAKQVGESVEQKTNHASA